MVRSFLTTLSVLVLIAACGGSDDTTPKTGNGVNDLAQACQIRATWVRANNDCSVCESGAINAHCDCDALRAFSGACLDQQNARKGVCPQSVDDCVDKCDRTDCTCIEACYTGNDACKKATDARDGCVAATCTDHCK